jgi:hypothetical protein
MARRKQAPRVTFVAARAIGGGAKLIHRMAPGNPDNTACGRSLERWSVSYIHDVPGGLDVLRCRAKPCQPLAEVVPLPRGQQATTYQRMREA